MAINTKKIKLKTVLLNNKRWPLIIVGATVADFDAPVMPATIAIRDLNTGEWVAELAAMKASRMVINGLDRLTVENQQKFIRLLKDRRAGLHKLPENIQILIPVESGEKISKQIIKLCLVYNV